MLHIEHHNYGIVWKLYSGTNRTRPHCWGVTYAPEGSRHGSGPAWLNGRDVAKYDGYGWSWTRRMFLVVDAKTARDAGPGNWLAGIVVILEPGGEWVR